MSEEKQLTKSGYTRQEILDLCTGAFENKKEFYQKTFINYRGKTTDTEEYYTEVVAEFLCKHIVEYKNGIDCIPRKLSYKVKGHDGVYNCDSNREEEIVAMKLFNQSRELGPFDHIGDIIDYQTPLKATRYDQVGKIDLLSFDGEILRILELKKPDSEETMLRCVLEGFTYLKIVDGEKLIKSWEYDVNKVILKASPFVFYNGNQYQEMLQPRPYLKKLMSLLDSKPYYIVNETPYVVVDE